MLVRAWEQKRDKSKRKEKKKADYKDREAKVAVSQCPVEGSTVQLMTL